MGTVRFDFSDENFVVTGASSGMGRQIAEELAASGAMVLAIARREEKLRELAEGHPGRIIPKALDVCDTDGMREGVSSFVAEHGRLHGAVHAAGIFAGTPLRAFDETKARKIMDVSFWSGIRLMQIVNQQRNSAEGCSSVLFASVAATIGEKSNFAYSAAKSALQAAVRSIAKEIYPRGNRINTVSPGWVHTEMTCREEESVPSPPKFVAWHLLGVGEPENVSGMVLFLLSERARWVTGADFTVDGGYLLGGYN